MCRIFNISLTPIPIKEFFFKKQDDTYTMRSREELISIMNDRRDYALFVAQDCSMKNTKAGYDAAGLAVGYKNIGSLLEELQQSSDQVKESGLDTVLEQVMSYFLPAILTDMRIAKDGGDLLKTWSRLVKELELQPDEFITSLQTHIRQASQGDMYSKANAHPHTDNFESDTFTTYVVRVGQKKLTPIKRALTWHRSLFADSHNGDINDAEAYRILLQGEGFSFDSNSDSCIEPALKRFLYEHLISGHLVGAIHKLAYTDASLIGKSRLLVAADGTVGQHQYELGQSLAGAEVSIAFEDGTVEFFHQGKSVGSFQQRGFLKTDQYSTVNHKILSIDRLAHRLQDNGAKKVTIAAAVATRVLEYSNPSSKFVFQSLSTVGKPHIGYLGGGTYTLVRGGSREGGEEGGEAVFYIPREWDPLNYQRAVILTGSEENSFKERVTILDAELYNQGKPQQAAQRFVEINHIPGVQARAIITEGILPVFDVLPGEILEVNADGDISLFDIYTGEKIALADTKDQSIGEVAPLDLTKFSRIRKERLAPLKVFQLEYRDASGHPCKCPFNKYGEEILVIQPMALKNNRDKLFYKDRDGKVRLRTGNDGLGLTMGSDNEDVRRLIIRSLQHKVVAAAGTSFMISQTAAFMSRKLGLHTLPTQVLEGFTGSDTFPSFINKDTLLLANSNTGGTADTIKFVQQLTNLQEVLRRAEMEMERRDPTKRDVGGTLALIREIKKHLHAGQRIEDLTEDMLRFLHDWMPWIYVVTNIEASYLGNMGKGVDRMIRRPAGVGVTDLPEEECVGSTFAALASLQWQLALDTYLGEVREDISREYAARVYEELYQVPEVIEQITGNQELIADIERFSAQLIGGNSDFIYTGYVDGVFEEQAHKAAEMIQEMFVGWQFFMFQHGKYAHIKRQTRFQLGSIVGHNAPPPDWHFFNERARKSPREIGPRAAVTFMLAHESDKQGLLNDYAYPVDYLFSYPSGSIVSYPFQAIVIGQMISYIWGLQKGKIGEMITELTEPFVAALLTVDAQATEVPPHLRVTTQEQATYVLAEFTRIMASSQIFDNISVRRKDFIQYSLCLLADDQCEMPLQLTYEGYLKGDPYIASLAPKITIQEPITSGQYLTVLKELALELSNAEQAKRLADHFLIDPVSKKISSRKLRIRKPNGLYREVLEYDYWCEYEGLGTFYSVDPVHPPKVAKAKKGWL